MHLVDGLPYGRVANRPLRPIVHIPPRKRRRIDAPEPSDIDEIEFEDENSEPLLQITGAPANAEDEDEDSEDDQDFVLDEEDDDYEDDDSDEGNDELDVDSTDADDASGSKMQGKASGTIRNVSVRFAPTSHALDPFDENTVKDVVSLSKSGTSSRDHLKALDGAARTNAGTTGTLTDKDLARTNDVTQPSAGTPESSSDDSSSDDSSSNDFSSDDSSSEGSSSEDDSSSADSSSDGSTSGSDAQFRAEVSKPPPLQKKNGRLQGSRSTQERNRRKMHGRRLRYLQSQGVLEPTARVSDLTKYDHAMLCNEVRRRLARNIPTTGILDEFRICNDQDNGASVIGHGEAAENKDLAEDDVLPEPLQDRPTAGIARGVMSPVGDSKATSDDSATPISLIRSSPVASSGPAPQQPLQAAAIPSTDTASTEANSSRVRLDVDTSRRLMFNSLGVRNPKSKEEEEQLRDRMAAKTKKTPASRSATPRVSDSTDPDFWRQKLVLTAHESHPDHPQPTTAPPFPFKQRWDEIQRRQPARTKKRKRQSDRQDEWYEDDETSVALDYDDPVEEAADNTADVEDGSAAPDLPELPSDLGALPLLTKVDCIPCAIIAFSRVECSAATSWQPRTAPVRTALVHSFENGELDLELALRDRPSIHFDDEGRRIYDKFETVLQLEDDDGGDIPDGRVCVAWTELLEARLVRPALPGAKGEEVAIASDGEKADEVEMVQDSMPPGLAPDADEEMPDATEPLALGMGVEQAAQGPLVLGSGSGSQESSAKGQAVGAADGG